MWKISLYKNKKKHCVMRWHKGTLVENLVWLSSARERKELGEKGCRRTWQKGIKCAETEKHETWALSSRWLRHERGRGRNVARYSRVLNWQAVVPVCRLSSWQDLVSVVRREDGSQDAICRYTRHLPGQADVFKLVWTHYLSDNMMPRPNHVRANPCENIEKSMSSPSTS